MNTLFEIIVHGEDPENEIAAADAALDEVARIETVLSRFDPASEVTRVNREAHQNPVLVSYELLQVLEICQSNWEKTLGYFDITASSENPGFKNVAIDFAMRKISFADANTQLDFGAFGKGYALDCAARILKENGVQNALLHGGTSSVLAIGNEAHVGLRNPWSNAVDIEDVLLCNEGLSSSATFHQGETISDIIDPFQRASLHGEAGCVVIGATALEAEIYSTALLSMGKERAENFCSENLSPNSRVLWMSKIDGKPSLEWMTKSL